MNKTLRFSLSVTLTSFVVAAGCSGKSENGGLSDPPPASTGSGASGATGPMVEVDAGDIDAFEPPPMPEPDPDVLECDALQELGECGGTSVAADLEPVNLLLVIDKSGSMEDTPEGFDVNKWDALETALGEALGAADLDLNYGLLLYPDQAIDLECTEGCCAVPDGADAINVPIAPGTNSVRSVLEVVADTAPGGGTPTAAALARALEYFTTGDGADLAGDNYVLLATDGGPNCNPDNVCEADTCTSNLDGVCTIDNCCTGVGELCLDDQAVVTQLAALRDAGIPTFVIGIPGTEAYAGYLDTFAIEGGVPNPDAPPEYYAVEASGGVQALTDTITAITSTLIRSCTVPLAEEPPNADLVNVAVNCEVVPSEDGAAWEIPADAPDTVVLTGNVCTFIETEGVRRIDIVYGCPTLR